MITRTTKLLKNNIEEKMKEGYKLLSTASKEQLDNASYLYNLQRSYGLSVYGAIIEHCSDRIYNILDTAHTYTDVKENEVLSIIAKKDKELLDREPKYRFDSTSEILVDYFNINPNTVEQYIKERNHVNHEKELKEEMERSQQIENIIEEIKKPSKCYISTIPVSMSDDTDNDTNNNNNTL